MNPRRFFEVYRTDFRFQFRRPLLWVLVVIAFPWGLRPKVHVASGDTDEAEGLDPRCSIRLLPLRFLRRGRGGDVHPARRGIEGRELHGTRLTAAEYVGVPSVMSVLLG
jgi:hypothetical protein